MSDPALPPLRIHLLGGFRVSAGTRSVAADSWRLRKAATLVKVLALSTAHRLHREQLLDLLWPELDPSAAANNLHQALHVARRVLAVAPGPSSPHLRLQDDLLLLGLPGTFWIDVEAFETSAAEARRTGDRDTYETAISLYGGDLLPEDLYEEWTADRREGLRGLHLALLLELADLHEAENRPGQAIETLRRAVSSDPALEEAHVRLMWLFARAGQRHQSLRQYEQLQQALRQELDAEPEETTRQLFQRILAGQLSSAVTVLGQTAPARVAQAPREVRRHNLPAALSSFVGREPEIAEVERLLGMTRLLTITGAGGVGKSRLALHVAGKAVERFRDGVWLVELAPLSDPALVPRAVAGVLDVAEQAGQPLNTTLTSALEAKQLLLILDNCEHLADVCAGLAEMLLQSCPRLQVLATSREGLGIAGEMSKPVPPLSLPDLRFPLGDLPSADELLGCESVRLFVERAQYRQPAFVLTAHNAPAVIQICRQLDGIPLAIELAAARIGSLSVEQIADRLHDALGLLTGGGRTARPGHQTLASALDWSYDLLSASERTLFNRLSVFVGAWSLEAAEALCALPGSDQHCVAGDALDLVSRLVDKSLVVAEAGPDREVRYRLLEPVRQYAYRRLAESGGAEAAHGAHAAWFLELATQAELELFGSEQALWLDRLEQEHDNLRAALAWLAVHEHPDRGLRMAAALWRFWFTRGHLREGSQVLEQLLGRPGIADASASRAVRANALNGAGALAYYQSDLGRAMTFYEQALAIRRELGDIRGSAALLGNMGLVVKDLGDSDRAIALYEEELALERKLADPRGMSHALNNLGVAALDKGDYQRALELLEESLAIKRMQTDKAGVVSSLNNLGAVALEQRNYAQAEALFNESIALARELGLKRSIATALQNLGRAAQEQGDFTRAWTSYEESFPVLHEAGSRVQNAECLESAAVLLNSEGELQHATRLFGAASAIRESLATPATRFDQARNEAVLTNMRRALGEHVFDEVWAQGQALTLEQAIESVLERAKRSPDRAPSEEGRSSLTW